MSLLKNIKLSESQEKEFSNRLETWKEEAEQNIKATYEEKVSSLTEEVEKLRGSRITEDGDLDLSDEEAGVLKVQLQEWKDKIKDQAEDEIGDKFYEAFELQKKKMSQAYSNKFIKTIKEMYEEIEVAAREKIMESNEFKAFSEMKKLIAPFIIEGEYSDTVLEDVEKLKGIIKEQKDKMDGEKIKAKLDQLTEGMPSEIKADFIETLGSFKTEDELIEKYQRHIRLLNNVKNTIVTEMADEELNSNTEALDESGKVKDTEEQLQEEVEQTDTISTKKKTKKLKKKRMFAETLVNSPATAIVESAEKDLEDSIDYDILTEDFQRSEKKVDALDRMKELAGL